MIVYQESEDGWNFSVDLDTGVVVPGEFRFVTFNDSPCVEYTSGGFHGTRTYDTQENVRERLLGLGFVEVDHAPEAVKHLHDPTPLTQDDYAWLCAQLRPGLDYIQFGDQYILSLTEDEMAEWLPKIRERKSI